MPFVIILLIEYQIGVVNVIVQCNSTEFEAIVVAQFDALMEALVARRQQLLGEIGDERQRREMALRNQLAATSATLQQSASLLQFGIEVLREQDCVSFLQVTTIQCRC